MTGIDATLLGRRILEVQGGTLSVTTDSGEALVAKIDRRPLHVGRSPACELVLADPQVSAVHAELVANPGGVLLRDLGSRNGTWIGDARISEALLSGTVTIAFGGRIEATFVATEAWKVDLQARDRFGRLYGSGPRMRALFGELAKVSRTDLTALVLGETGTGKELVARSIHEASRRRHGPFVVVDCGAIPTSLADATLFGHVRGAFTGATSDRRSPFLEANGGTLFLDELGELPPEIQPRLLRAIAERRIKAVGANTYQDFDARIVAATRRDLAVAINAGTFRSDLYFRLAQVRLTLPPLRERREDIAGLVKLAFAELGARSAFRRVPHDELDRLMRHDWPGNVRELRNAVRTAFALAADDGRIEVSSHVGIPSDGPPDRELSSMGWHDAKRYVLERFEKSYLSTLLAQTGGNVTEVARRTGLDRSHVRDYVNKHGLPARRRRKAGGH